MGLVVVGIMILNIVVVRCCVRSSVISGWFKNNSILFLYLTLRLFVNLLTILLSFTLYRTLAPSAGTSVMETTRAASMAEVIVIISS